MPTINTIFCDIGGVILTNGWDRYSRVDATRHFAIDHDEFESRHQRVVEAFDSGQMNLDEYLDETIFHTSRPFSREQFIHFMQTQSQPIPESLELLRRLANDPDLLLVAVNNESRELNRYRIDTFDLRSIFRFFVSSCYVHARKPAPEIYRAALDLTQRDPATCLFIDDRSENLPPALELGMQVVHCLDPAELASGLAGVGVPGI